MKTIRDIENFKGVKALVRVDFNVPVVNGAVVDDFRIRKILPTLQYLRERGAKSILISHIEDNSDASATPSLEPVARHLKKLGVECTFVKNYRNAASEIESAPEGGFILLENLRGNAGEKKNDKKFAAELASLADLYINEAFSVSHRAHASVVAVTEFLPSYAGLLFESEVAHLSEVFHPQRPFLFILGGAKFETKLPLIEKFLDIADAVFVGGALANNFFKEKGWNVGGSLISPEDFNLKRFFDNPKLILPTDVVVTNTDNQGSAIGQNDVKKPDAIASNDIIMDAGPATLDALKKMINGGQKQILWNGPLGAYERGFKKPTMDVAQAIALATGNVDATNSGRSGSSGADTIVGGGDTLATIAELHIEDKFSFISTGGGAMLDFLALGTLPGIEALEKSGI
jgi:3-phosphoglycerate kinase